MRSSVQPSVVGFAELPFGQQSLGNTALFLRFDVPFDRTRTIVAAHLVLTPCADAVSGPFPIAIKIDRFRGSWPRTDASTSSIPRLSNTSTSVLASTWAGQPLRVDVTAMLRDHVADDPSDIVVAIVSSAQTGVGETYSLGVCGSRAPVMDVYVR